MTTHYPEAGSKTLSEDIESFASSPIIRGKLNTLRGKSILITGATGLIGSLLVRNLAYINRKYDLNMTILPVIRNKEKGHSVFGELLSRRDIDVIECDITSEEFIEKALEAGRGKVDYIIHAAAVTTSKMMIERPVETIVVSIEGTKHLLDLAVKAGTESFLYISSMEMYGRMEEGSIAYEDKLGYIDPLAVRSNYPESKRMCENMCIAYLHEYNVPVKIARLAQTFGAGILPWENRVFAQFARSVMNGEDIVLHTKGLSEGNYCYTSDAMKGLMTILLNGLNGEAYNVANPAAHTTIAAMAEMAAKEFSEGKSQVVFDIPETNMFGYAADTKMLLPSDKLQKLGWRPETDLKTAYARLIGFLKEIKLEVKYGEWY